MIKTVNIIEYNDDTITSIRAWNEDETGNKEAEDTFKTIIKEHDPEVTDEEMQMFLNDGMHEQGDYQLFLVHSS